MWRKAGAFTWPEVSSLTCHIPADFKRLYLLNVVDRGRSFRDTWQAPKKAAELISNFLIKVMSRDVQQMLQGFLFLRILWVYTHATGLIRPHVPDISAIVIFTRRDMLRYASQIHCNSLLLTTLVFIPTFPHCQRDSFRREIKRCSSTFWISKLLLGIFFLFVCFIFGLLFKLFKYIPPKNQLSDVITHQTKELSTLKLISTPFRRDLWAQMSSNPLRGKHCLPLHQLFCYRADVPVCKVM